MQNEAREVKGNKSGKNHPNGTIFQYAYNKCISNIPIKFQKIWTKTVGGVEYKVKVPSQDECKNMLEKSRAITLAKIIRVEPYFNMHITNVYKTFPASFRKF